MRLLKTLRTDESSSKITHRIFAVAEIGSSGASFQWSQFLAARSLDLPRDPSGHCSRLLDWLYRGYFPPRLTGLVGQALVVLGDANILLRGGLGCAPVGGVARVRGGYVGLVLLLLFQGGHGAGRTGRQATTVDAAKSTTDNAPRMT